MLHKINNHDNIFIAVVPSAQNNQAQWVELQGNKDRYFHIEHIEFAEPPAEGETFFVLTHRSGINFKYTFADVVTCKVQLELLVTTSRCMIPE